MKRMILAVGLTLAVVPAASAKTPTARHARQYQHAYSAVVHKLGHRAPGRNIVRNGSDNRHAATDAQVLASLDVLRRMLAPPAPPALALATSASVVQPPAPTSAYRAPAPAASYSGGGYTIPSSIVQCESGGNYSAVNPSSGAGGAYQILPSTWAAYGGTGLPQNAPPAEQGAIAAKIYAGGAGRGQWSC